MQHIDLHQHSQDIIAQTVPDADGTMLTPIVLGADKTTVSVATGNQAFHPVYMSLGNIHNDMRRSHRDSVVPVAFLPIPHGIVHVLPLYSMA